MKGKVKVTMIPHPTWMWKDNNNNCKDFEADNMMKVKVKVKDFEAVNGTKVIMPSPHEYLPKQIESNAQ